MTNISKEEIQRMHDEAENARVGHIHYSILVDPTLSVQQNEELAMTAIIQKTLRVFGSYMALATLAYLKDMEMHIKNALDDELTEKVKIQLGRVFRDGQLAGMTALLFKSYLGQITFDKTTEKGEGTN